MASTCEVCGEQYPTARRGRPRIKPRCDRHRLYHQHPCPTCGTLYWRDRRAGREFCAPECAPRLTCEQCGAGFVPVSYPRRRPRWCSSDCKKQFLSRANRKPKVAWNCAVCDVLVVRDSGPVGMYCKEHKHSKHSSRTEIVCLICGNKAMGFRPEQRYCSHACYRESLRIAAKEAKLLKPAPMTQLEWKQCGNSECQRWICKPGRKYCNKECDREAALAKQGCRNRPCKRCGVGLGRVSLKTYCEPCRLIRHKENSSRGRKKQKNHRQRARHFGVEYEKFDCRLVFKRDNWTCGICRKPIDPALKSPDPMSPSLDHIVPMARGGGHTYANCQAAHMICNSRKVDSMDRPNQGLQLIWVRFNTKHFVEHQLSS